MPIRPHIMAHMAQPFGQFIGDLQKSWRWIVGFLVFIMAWLLISSLIFSIIENKSYSLSLYFTIINMTTGFADIMPQTDIGKIIAVINSLLGLLAFGILVAVITLALQP